MADMSNSEANRDMMSKLQGVIEVSREWTVAEFSIGRGALEACTRITFPRSME